MNLFISELADTLYPGAKITVDDRRLILGRDEVLSALDKMTDGMSVQEIKEKAAALAEVLTPTAKKVAPGADLEAGEGVEGVEKGKVVELSHDDLKNKYPLIPDDIIDRLGKIKLDPTEAGSGEWRADTGLSIKASTEDSLLHEVAHIVDNVLTDGQIIEWEKISKEELPNGILGNKPDKLKEDPYNIWENLYTAFSIYHRKKAGMSLSKSQENAFVNYKKTFGFIENNLAKPTPPAEKAEPDVAREPWEMEKRWLVDNKTRKTLDSSHVGDKEQWQLSVDIDIGKHLQKDVIDIHTHPDKSMPGPEDWSMLAFGHSKKVRVILNDGSVVTLEKPSSLRITPREMKDKWQKIEDEIFESKRSDNMTAEEIIEEINTKLSKETGINIRKNTLLDYVEEPWAKEVLAEYPDLAPKAEEKVGEGEAPIGEIRTDLFDELWRRSQAGEKLPVTVSRNEKSINKHLDQMSESMLRDWHSTIFDKEQQPIPPQELPEGEVPPEDLEFEDTTRYSLGAPKPKGMNPNAVTLLTKSISKKWKNLPNVTVVKSIDEIPKDIRDRAANIENMNVKGLFATRKGEREIYLITDNLNSKGEVIKTFAEESLGHDGLRQSVGKDLDNVLDNVWLKENKRIGEIVEKYKLDTTTPEGRRNATDEWISKQIANDSLLKQWWDRIIAAIRQWLRRVDPTIKISTGEIKTMARDAIIKGKKKPLGVMDIKGMDVKLSFKEAIKKITDNPAFNRWFGKSKVVDDKGEPLVVYHGDLRKKVTVLHPEEALETEGVVFFTDSDDVAETFRYPREYGEVITQEFDEEAGEYEDLEPGELVESYLSITNPLILEGDEAQRATDDTTYQGEMVRKAKADGHDGIIFKDVEEGVGDWINEGTTYGVFSPTQIKSIYNVGTFSPTDPDIMLSKAPTETAGEEFLRRWAEEPQETKDSMKKIVESGKTIPGKPPSEPSPYEQSKDNWFKDKDWALHKSSVETTALQKKIRKALDLKRYSKEAVDIDKAIHIYLDLKRNPGHLEEYYKDQTAEQKRIIDLSKTIDDNPKLKKIADGIAKEYENISALALKNEVIFNILDNYVGRAWKIPKGFSTDILQKFKTSSRHAKARIFETILEGQAKGLELQVEGASTNLQAIKEEIARVVEDRNLIKALRSAKWRDGKPMFSTKKLSDDHVKIEHPNFKVWEFAGKVDLEEGAPSEKGMDYIVTEEGTILKKVPLYAPKEIAKNLNRILGTSKLKGTLEVGGVSVTDTVTKYNAILKSYLLMTGFFHHQAFMRSYMFGTRKKHRAGASWNPIKAYRDGLEAIKNYDPTIELLVRNGLTLGKMQDWMESIVTQEDTIIGRAMDKAPMTKAIKDKLNDLRDRQAKWLFGNFGAGLKAQAGLIEYQNATREHPEMSSDDRAKMVANLINDDFGGLHLQRLGRDPTTQHLFRLFALAPDWTESNIRSMVKMVRGGSKAEKEMYRRFWTSVLTKGLAATYVANLLLSLGDDEDAIERFKKAWAAGHLKWLDMDITPIYKLLGGETEARKYFSILGHFKDPIKFMTQSPFKSAHYKGSVIYGMMYELLAGTDWKGAGFTNFQELIGVDDKGVYLTSKKGKYRIGDPKGGKMAGEFVSPRAKKGIMSPDRLPSYILSQLQGVQPIFLQQLIGFLTGELEGFDATLKAMGAHSGTTYPTTKKTLESFVDTYMDLRENKKPIKPLIQKIREYNERQKKLGADGNPIPWKKVINRVKKMIKIERMAEGKIQ